MIFVREKALSIYRIVVRVARPLVSSCVKKSSRVLIYHDINKGNAKKFEEHVRYISDYFEVVTVGDFVKLYNDKELRPDKLYCSITFDDGFRSVIEHAIPILDKYGFNATIFVNYDLYKFSENQDISNLKIFCRKKFPRLLSSGLSSYGLTRADIKHLINKGYEIGAHTITHPDLTQLTPSQLKYELKEPIRLFKKEFNYHLTVLAYPYGRRNNFNEIIKEKIKESGYKAAFTGISKNPNKLGPEEHFEFPRSSVSLSWSKEYFESVFLGAEDIKDYLCLQY